MKFLTFSEKVQKAISLAENLEQLEWIEDKIKTTPEINRRTKEGKELQKELLSLTLQKAHEMIEQGATPF